MRALRTAGRILLLLAFVAVLYAPLARSGWAPEDLPLIADTSAQLAPGPPSPAADGASLAGLRPLAVRSLELTNQWWQSWGDASLWSHARARALRAENLLLLVGAALLAGACVARALQPWVGRDAAAAAARASALILACHPLGVGAVASPAARGELLALLFMCASAVLFLRARQERSSVPMTLAWAAALCAGFCSALAVLLPALLAGLELVAARRGRPLAVRLRTGAITFAVFGAAVALHGVTSVLWGGGSFDPLPFDPAALARGGALAAAVERLGVAIVPVLAGAGHALSSVASALAGDASEFTGPALAQATETLAQAADGLVIAHEGRVLGFVLAVGVLLCALQPALIAARSAPRLWGTLLCGWCIAMAFVLARDAELAERGARASAFGLLPAAAVMAASLGIACTALSGARRWVLPLVIAGGYVVLGNLRARDVHPAAAPWEELHADLVAAHARHGDGVHYLVVDPPSAPADAALRERVVALLLDPGAAHERSLRAIAAQALPALVRDASFAQLRREGLVLVFEPQLLVPQAAPGPRTSLKLDQGGAPSSGAAAGPHLWRADARSPLFEVDPLALRAARWSTLVSTSSAQAPQMSWRARAGATEQDVASSVTGVWVRGADGPVALFDLARSFAWLSGRLVRRVWLEHAPPQIAAGEVLADVPELQAELLTADGDAWRLRVPASARPHALHHEERWVLALFDPLHLGYAELEAQAAGDELAFPGAHARALQLAARGGAQLSWSLECRVGASAIARSSGQRRIEAAPATLER